MSKDLMIIALGAWVGLLPFLGFPARWDTWILVASGVLIITLMLLLRRDVVTYIERFTSKYAGGDGVFVESAGSAREEKSTTSKEESSPEAHPEPEPEPERAVEPEPRAAHEDIEEPIEPEPTPKPRVRRARAKAPARSIDSSVNDATPPAGIRARRVRSVRAGGRMSVRSRSEFHEAEIATTSREA